MLFRSLNVATHRNDVRSRVASSVVKDTKTGDLIIKLVNMLPVKVDMNLEAGDLTGYNTNAECSLLTGKPADRDLKPATSEMIVSEKFDYSLPAYSFTVIRVKKELAKKR